MFQGTYRILYEKPLSTPTDFVSKYLYAVEFLYSSSVDTEYVTIASMIMNILEKTVADHSFEESARIGVSLHVAADERFHLPFRLLRQYNHDLIVRALQTTAQSARASSISLTNKVC